MHINKVHHVKTIRIKGKIFELTLILKKIRPSEISQKYRAG